jgi:hypothetical protein
MAAISNFLRAATGGLALGALLAACGGGGDGSANAPTPAAPAAGAAAPQPVPRVVPQSDLEIARQVYAGLERTPEGFYSEPAAPWTGQVATLHLKNSDIGAGPAGTPRYELCADRWDEALDWSEQAAAVAPTSSDLVETGGNDRWFEFTRILRTPDPSYVRMRVYQCAYLDRSGVDLRAPTGSAGRLNLRPVTAAGLAQLSEYLWQFTIYNNYGHAVLASRAAAATAGGMLAHELVIASVERAEAGATCDRVTVHAWTHAADVASGELALQDRVLWRFGARERDGVTELCQG